MIRLWKPSQSGILLGSSCGVGNGSTDGAFRVTGIELALRPMMRARLPI